MKLVEEARDWWRCHSTYAFGLLAAIPATWLSSPELQGLVPAHWIIRITPVIAVIGFLVRFRKQALRVPRPPPSNDFHQGDSP